MFTRFTLTCILSLLPIIAHAQPAQTTSTDGFYLSPVNNPKEVAEFPLTEEFLSKVEAIQKAIVNLTPEAEGEKTGNDNSIEGLTASIEARPNLTVLITMNDLKPRDYVIGTMALKAALAAASSASDENSIIDETNTVTPQNIEFGKKYADRIRALFE